jgi:DNA-binding transcriptional LysR family regulator
MSVFQNLEVTMDRFQSMAVFVTVVEAGGFSAASRRLGKPLATISRKVSELEEELGITLLNRTTRHVTLTDPGRQYFEACRRILKDIEEAERTATGEYQTPKGELIVTAPIVFGRMHVLPIVTEFMAAYPKIQVRLVLEDRVVSLLEENADVAVRIAQLSDSSMVAKRVGKTTRVLCASPDYLAARGTPASLDDLDQHDCINIMALPPAGGWVVAVAGKEVIVPIEPRFVVSTAEAGVEAAVRGAGIVQALCYQVTDAVCAGRLTVLLRVHEPRHAPVSLVYQRGKTVPAKLRAFLDMAAPRLQSALSRTIDC